MRTVTRFTSPFSPLRLAVEDEAQLEAVANFFVAKTVAQYEKFLLHEEQVVNLDEWKLLKRKEDMRVFAQRRQKDMNRRRSRTLKRNQSENLVAKRLASSIFGSASSMFGGGNTGSTWNGGGSLSSCTSATAGGSTSSFETTPEADGLPPVNVEVPVLLAVGSIPGSLEDVMYGTIAPSVDAMRVRSSYIGDHVVDGAVLATIISPSASDPFRSLSVKWIQQDYPLHMRSMLKHRDLVCLEATGTTTIASGERVGYHLIHSVHFPQTHVINGVVRGNISLCTVFRQQRQQPRASPSGSCVDVFTKCCLNPSEGFMRTVTINTAAQALISVDKIVHCARMKKLAWVALHRQTLVASEALITATSKPTRRAKGKRRQAAVNDSSCATCKKRAAPGLRLLGMSERVRCKICSRFVCSACKMKKKLSYVPFDSLQLLQQEVTLCNICVHSSMIRANALEIASDEMAAYGRHHVRYVDSPPVRMGRSRGPKARGCADRSRSPNPCYGRSSESGTARGCAPIISSSIGMDPTLEFYGEPLADRW